MEFCIRMLCQGRAFSAPRVWIYNKKKDNTEETHHMVVTTLKPRVLDDCKAIVNKHIFEVEQKHSNRTQYLNKLIHYKTDADKFVLLYYNLFFF